MPDLLAGTTILALDTPPSVWATNATTISSVTDDDFVPGSPEVGVQFIAPTTGRVWVTTGGGSRSDSVPGDRIWMNPQIFEGPDSSGIEIASPDSVSRRFGTGTRESDYVYGDRSVLVEGLTPGQTYFARHMYRRNGSDGAADITVRTIVVAPAT